MADTNIVNSPPPPPPAPPPNPNDKVEGIKYAGKYDSPEAFIEGFKNLDTKMGTGLFAAKQVYGKDGVFSDIGAAEIAYKAHDSLLGKIGAATPKPKDEPKGAAKEPGKDGDIKIGGDAPAAPTITAKGIARVLTKAGLSGKESELTKAWAEKGELTADQYAAFEKADVDRELVDTYFSGQQAIAKYNATERETSVKEAVALVGTREQFDMLIQQAKDFVDPSEIDDLNARLNNSKQIKGAVRQLLMMHKDSLGNGKAKPLIGGDAQSAGGAPVTKSEFSRVMAQAKAGDKEAIRRIEATPLETFLDMSR